MDERSQDGALGVSGTERTSCVSPVRERRLSGGQWPGHTAALEGGKMEGVFISDIQ